MSVVAIVAISAVAFEVLFCLGLWLWGEHQCRKLKRDHERDLKHRRVGFERECNSQKGDGETYWERKNRELDERMAEILKERLVQIRELNRKLEAQRPTNWEETEIDA